MIKLFREYLYVKVGEIMKNKKIISLTIAIVAVVLIAVLGLSRFFETSWQNESTVDNSLSADIVENSESAFDYPFEINNDMTLFVNTYPNNSISSIEDFRGGLDGEYISQPDSDMISYQQAANYAGEALKYLYGFTQQQIHTAIITYFDMPFYSSQYRGSTFYSYYNTWSYTDDSDEVITIKTNVYVNPYNGEIMQIVVSDGKITSQNSSDNDIISDADKKELLPYAMDVLKTIGIAYEVDECYIVPQGYSVDGEYKGKGCAITLKLTDEKFYNFIFGLQNDNYLVCFENSTDTGKHEQWVTLTEHLQQYKYSI